MRRRKEILDPRLGRALQMFERWRSRHRKRGPLPEDLWRSAVALAGQYGAYRISRELRVNYVRLRSRLEAAAKSPGAAHPAFVEVEVAPSTLTGEYAIDLENSRGEHLTLRVKGHSGPELMAALGKVFFGRA